MAQLHMHSDTAYLQAEFSLFMTHTRLESQMPQASSFFQTYRMMPTLLRSRSYMGIPGFNTWFKAQNPGSCFHSIAKGHVQPPPTHPFLCLCLRLSVFT